MKSRQNRNTICEVSETTLRLQEYIMTKPHGTELSYSRIAADTGIKMTEPNKQKLRSAIRRARREYAAIHVYGIVLADPGLVLPILSNRLIKIDRAVRRGDRTHKTLQEQFFAQLSPEAQQKVLFAGAVFGAIRIAADNGRRLHGKKTKKISNMDSINIPVPNFNID